MAREKQENSQYREALDLFDLSEAYTCEELRTRYNTLVKEAHPDRKGTAGLFRKVQEAYELLKVRKKC